MNRPKNDFAYSDYLGRPLRKWDDVEDLYEAHRVLCNAFRYSDSQPDFQTMKDFMEISFDMIRWALFTYRNCKQGVAAGDGSELSQPEGRILKPQLMLWQGIADDADAEVPRGIA